MMEMSSLEMVAVHSVLQNQAIYALVEVLVTVILAMKNVGME